MTRTHFVGKVQLLHQHFIGMGELTLGAMSHALDCLPRKAWVCYEKATDLENTVDEEGRKIHDQALEILVLQSPVAGDARLVTGILESSVELEQIADYAYEIAGLAFRADRPPMVQLLSEVLTVGERVRALLATGIDSWRELNSDLALSVRAKLASVRKESRNVSEDLYELTAAPDNVQYYVNLVLVCQHFQRIARHVAYLAEYAAAAAPAEGSNEEERSVPVRPLVKREWISTTDR